MSAGSGDTGSSGPPKKFVFRMPKVPPPPGAGVGVGVGNQGVSVSAPVPQPLQVAPVRPPSTATARASVPVPLFKTPDPRPRPPVPQWKSTFVQYGSASSGPRGAGPRPGPRPPARAPTPGPGFGSNLKQQKLQFRPKAPTPTTIATAEEEDDDDCQIISVSQNPLAGPPPQGKATTPAGDTHRHRFKFKPLTPPQGPAAEPQPSTSSGASGFPSYDPISSNASVNLSSGATYDTTADWISDFPMDDDDDDFAFEIPDDIEIETNWSNVTTGSTTSNGSMSTTEPPPPLDFLDPEGESRRETNATFHSLSKRDPWCRLFSLQELIPIKYEVASKSHHQPLQNRIEIAHSALTYVERQVKSDLYLEHGLNPKSSISKEVVDVLNSFEHMLKRILMNSKADLSPSDTEEVTRLLDRIWTDHVADEVDLRKTRILNLVLENTPSYLEDMLAALMKKALFNEKSDTKTGTTTDTASASSMPPAEFSALLRFCQSNSDNFKLVLNTMYEVWRSTRQNPLILQFTTQLLDSYTVWSRTTSPDVEQSGLLRPWSVYPTRFHPVLNFLAAVEEFASGGGDRGPAVPVSSVLACNENVQGELLRLINVLLEEQEQYEDQTTLPLQKSSTLFFLYTNSVLVQFIMECHKSGLIAGKGTTASREFPWLWKAVCRGRVFEPTFLTKDN